LAYKFSGGGIWSTKSIAGNLDHAPRHPIQAAFYVNATNQIWVITSKTWNVITKQAGWKWIKSGDRSQTFPELDNTQITSAWNAPATHTKSPVDFIGISTAGPNPKVYNYALQPLKDEFQYVSTVTFDLFSGPKAPNYGKVIGAWVVLENKSNHPAYNAISALSPMDFCPEKTQQTTVGPYMGVMTSTGGTYIFESEYCFQFISAAPSANVDYFKAPQAPDPSSVSATVWAQNHLVTFTSP